MEATRAPGPSSTNVPLLTPSPVFRSAPNADFTDEKNQYSVLQPTSCVHSSHEPKLSMKPLLTVACRFSLACTGLSAFSAVMYGSTSFLMVFLNKGLLMDFPYPLTVLTLQMAFSAFLVQLGALSGLLSIRPLSLSTARAMVPLSFLYNANVVFALASLRGINIPMYSALKRLNPLGVCAINHTLGKPRPPLEVLSSVLLITLGCVVAALGDFTFDLPSYSMAIASVFFQCSYLVLVERSGAEEGMTSSELLLYNSLLSLPVLGAMITISGEASSSFPLILTRGLTSPAFALALCLLLGMGCLLNFTVFLCTLCNSALTTTVVGVLKSAASTALGFFVLGGVGWATHSNVALKAMFVVGHLLNTGGGVWYTVARYKQKEAKKKGLEGGGIRLGCREALSLSLGLKEDGDDVLLLGREKHKGGGGRTGVRGKEEEEEAVQV